MQKRIIFVLLQPPVDGESERERGVVERVLHIQYSYSFHIRVLVNMTNNVVSDHSVPL